MTDYAISAVGRSAGNERLLDNVQNHEAVHFDKIGNRPDGNIWDAGAASADQIRIVQEASSSAAQLKTALTPWDDFTNRVVNKMNSIQNAWNQDVENASDKNLFKIDISSNSDMSLSARMQSLLKHMQSTLRSSLKIQRALLGSQLKIALVTTVGSAVKGAITTLYRQQG